MYKPFALALAVCAVSLAGVGLAASSPHPDAAPVIAAERAFAARGSEVPPRQAFLEWAAPDGVLVDSERGAENAIQAVTAWPVRDNVGFIKWWPLYSGISRSGDFGFTTGAATYGGDKGYSNFFTVWKKQPDGKWKWLIDMGANAPSASPFGPGTPVTVAPPSNTRGKYPEAAWTSLKAEEDRMVAEAGRSLAAAYAKRLMPASRIGGMEPQPAVGQAAWRAALKARPATVAMTVLGGGTASSGDLGYTYGTARWTGADGKPAQGVYMRVWQFRKQGWVILMDNLTADR